MNDQVEMARRTVLQALGGLALLTVPHAAAADDAPPGSGKPGEFDFLTGSWKIANRKRRKPGADEWDVFPGESTCWSILGGIASIEELRIPARNFAGMGLRMLDVEKGVWSDFWVNAKSGVLTTPGTTGRFENGAGVFVSEEDGVQVRGVWDHITPTSCRWSQAASRDGGKTWLDDWLMEWTRA
ncbi:MAG: hypothetical protein ABW221_09180 [Vicinamibacteria bacterium]